MCVMQCDFVKVARARQFPKVFTNTSGFIEWHTLKYVHLSKKGSRIKPSTNTDSNDEKTPTSHYSS